MRIIRVDSHEPDPALIEQAADALLDGGIVAYPTDTVYGLGCDATNLDAVSRLGALKQRAASEPFPIIIHTRATLRHLVADLTPEIDVVLRRHWPGGLTVVFQRRGSALSAVSPQGTLGIRIPDSPIALAIARALARPIVATSANLSGCPPLGCASEIAEVFTGRIDLIVEETSPRSDSDHTTPSTVLDLSGETPRILREGTIARADLARYLPTLE